MKIVIPGGSGHLGQILVRDFVQRGHEVVVLTRGAQDESRAPGAPRRVHWDGRSNGSWARELDGADALVHLSGRSVDCRYTKENLRAMLDSRVESTRAVGAACAAAARPPRVWLQASTATIYAHRFDAPNDELHGEIGGAEPLAPPYWRWSIDIARAWEEAQHAALLPRTPLRKVAMRTAMVMSTEPGGVFDVLARLTRLGLGGSMAGGRQYLSWIHERDFVRAVAWLLERDDLAGPVNLCSPEPLPQREFARILRAACRTPIGLPAAAWMLELGALLVRTDTELLLKSRRVVPARLLDSGFEFEFPGWREAAEELVARRRERRGRRVDEPAAASRT